jgi:protein involved in sex pheromone biosynthesis
VVKLEMQQIEEKNKWRGWRFPKTMGIAVVSLLLLVSMTGCSLFSKNNNAQPSAKNAPKVTSKPNQITVIPQDQSTQSEYQTIRPKTPSQTRGYIQYGVTNRVDVDELETQLQDLSKTPFGPGRYSFQEGRYLSPSFIDSLLSRKDKTHPDGLNPPIGKGKDPGAQAASNPKILSYILEQDYLTKKGSSYQLSGISLGISVNSVYSDNVYDPKSGNTYPVDVTLDPNKSMSQGKIDAQRILQKVRGIKGLENVPVFIGLYIESEPGSFIPGHYFAKTFVASGGQTIGNWTSVNQKVVLFPSSTAQNSYLGDSDKFAKFSDDIQSYFPNSIGVIGKGFYKDGNLSELTVTINERFYDKTETASFANYVAMLISDKFPFPQDTPVQVYINSVNQPEAIIVNRPNMDQPFVHVFTMYK